MNHHQWSAQDNLLVLTEFFRRYQYTEYDVLISSIAKQIGTSASSVKLKISNMIYILSNGEDGFSNYSEDSRQAVFKYLEEHPELSRHRMLLILK